jgi:fructose-bisphosphate aldolase, class II
MPSPLPHELFRHARAGGYAIGAFNAFNLETATAIVQAAEAERSPVVLQVSENAARYAGFAPLAALCRALRDAATVPVILHFDHAESLASAQRALDAGFQGVMLETAHLPSDESVARIREVVTCAARHGAVVEAELEVVHKPDRQPGRALDLGELRDLAERSGADLLALDVGSRHKQRQRETRLDLVRLARVGMEVEHPLVLHGGSGIHPEDLAHAISLGVAKVNLATDPSSVFTRALRESLGPDVTDPRHYLASAREAMRSRVAELLRALGCAGTAS